MGKMTVYHGSFTAVKKPGIMKNKNTKDFGPSFYCTVIREQAERWAKRYDSAVLNIYTVRMDTSLKIYRRRYHQGTVLVNGSFQVSDTPDKFLFSGCAEVSGICIKRGGAAMTGREDKKENDLFFTCSLIEYIARKTKNKRSDVVNALGKASVSKIYDLADVYHSDSIDRVSDDFIKAAGIEEGSFDNVAAAKYAVPSHWDIGKVYKRLILGIAREKNMDIADALFAAYNSFVTDKIQNYNSSFYCDAPQNILNAFLDGRIE